MKSLILLLSVALTQQSFAARLIAVKGECTTQVAQDRVSIILTAENRDKDLNVATKKTNEQYAKVRDEVTRLKLKDQQIQTTHYSVTEDREYKDSKTKVIGFIVSMGMQIETSEVDRAQVLFEIATKLAIKDVGNLNTFASSEKMKVAQDQCLTEAIKDAQRKANFMAKAVGGNAGKVQSLKEEYAEFSSPMQFGGGGNYRAKSMSYDSSPAPQIDARKQEIKTTVYAEFDLN